MRDFCRIMPQIKNKLLEIVVFQGVKLRICAKICGELRPQVTAGLFDAIGENPCVDFGDSLGAVVNLVDAVHRLADV